MKNQTYLYNNESAKELESCLSFDYLKEESRVEVVDNGLIIPRSGVYDDRGKYVLLSSEKNEANNDYYIDENIQYSDESVIYLGYFSQNHWGNFFIDNISRLWYLLENNLPQIKIVYCGSNNFAPNTFGASSKNAYRLFELFGIDKERLIDIRTPIKFRQVIVPQKSFVHWQYYTREYKKIYDFISSKVELSIPVYDKIYFTRRQLPMQKEAGEKEFESFFERNGFKIFAPEKLTLEEQIYLEVV